jgi:CRP/FNR family transcriptional regulator, cyclic AMP receptor protein
VRSGESSLRTIEIFQGIPPGELETLAAQLRWKRYAAHQQIIGHMEDSTDVFLVIEGSVRVIVYSASGKEVTFRDIPAGEYFGELAAIDGLPRSATVIALADSLLAVMSAETFWSILRRYPDFAAALVKRLAGSIRGLTARVFEFSTLAVRNRVQAELLRLAREHMVDDRSAVIRPAPTHAEIASRISTHREAVTRELNRLSHQGLVARQSGALVVRDVKQLSRLVQDVVGH